MGIDPGETVSDKLFLHIKITNIEFGYASAVSIGGEGMDSEIGSISYQLSESLSCLGSIRLVRFWSINTSQTNALVIQTNRISIRDSYAAGLQERDEEK